MNPIIIVTLIFLGLAAYFDYKRMKVHDSLFIIWAMSILITKLFWSAYTMSMFSFFQGSVYAIGIGLLLWGLSYKIKFIGQADIIIITIISFTIPNLPFLGIWLALSYFSVGVFRIVQRFDESVTSIKDFFKSKPVAFIPFMFLVYLAMIL